MALIHVCIYVNFDSLLLYNKHIKNIKLLYKIIIFCAFQLFCTIIFNFNFFNNTQNFDW